MRNPSTLMIWWSGSTRAPYLRTVSPSTSTRPSAISSSQCRRLPRPVAASTFCSRTPPGTSVSESRSPSPMAVGAAGGLRDLSRALFIARTGGLRGRVDELPDGLGCILDLVGQKRREVGQLLQAGQAEPFQEVAGRPVEDRAGLVFGPGLLDQAAQRQGAHHRVAVDAADR